MTFLTDGIAECNDADVKAALTNIYVGHLLPTNPVKGKKKKGNANFSATGAAVVGSATNQGDGRVGG